MKLIAWNLELEACSRNYWMQSANCCYELEAFLSNGSYWLQSANYCYELEAFPSNRIKGRTIISLVHQVRRHDSKLVFCSRNISYISCHVQKKIDMLLCHLYIKVGIQKSIEQLVKPHDTDRE